MLDALLRYDALTRGWIAIHHTHAFDVVMVTLSAVGRGGMVWLALGSVLAAVNRRLAPGALQLALAIGLASLMSDAILKPALGRLRPYDTTADVRVIDRRSDTKSFPSGHAANAFAGAYALARLWPAATVPLWALAILVAFSRIYVGVHYPLDVVSGALVGLACGIFVVGGSRWYSGGPAARRSHVPR